MSLGWSQTSLLWLGRRQFLCKASYTFLEALISSLTGWGPEHSGASAQVCSHTGIRNFQVIFLFCLLAE